MNSTLQGRARVVVAYARELQLDSLHSIERTLPQEIVELIIAAVGIPRTISQLPVAAFNDDTSGCYTVKLPIPNLATLFCLS